MSLESIKEQIQKLKEEKQPQEKRLAVLNARYFLEEKIRTAKYGQRALPDFAEYLDLLEVQSRYFDLVDAYQTGICSAMMGEDQHDSFYQYMSRLEQDPGFQKISSRLMVLHNNLCDLLVANRCLMETHLTLYREVYGFYSSYLQTYFDQGFEEAQLIKNRPHREEPNHEQD